MTVAQLDAPQPTPAHTILLVEDEVLVRLVIAEHLRDCGYRVLEAATASEAMAVLESDITVDVLFTDVQLPGHLDGFGLAQWCRQRSPGIRVIITSGLDRAAHRASDLCADEPYLKKPYAPTNLVLEIRRLLAGTRA